MFVYSKFLYLKMVRMSVLSDCLRSIINAEKAGKRQVTCSFTLLFPIITGSSQTSLQSCSQVPQSYAKAW